MEASVDFLLVCNAVTRDDSGNITLVGIFDNIESNNFPAIHPAMSITFRISGLKEDELKYKVEIINPKGNKVNVNPPESLEKRIKLKKESRFRAGVIINLKPLILEEEGEYTIRVTINGKESTETKFWAVKK